MSCLRKVHRVPQRPHHSCLEMLGQAPEGFSAWPRSGGCGGSILGPPKASSSRGGPTAHCHSPPAPPSELPLLLSGRLCRHLLRLSQGPSGADGPLLPSSHGRQGLTRIGNGRPSPGGHPRPACRPRCSGPAVRKRRVSTTRCRGQPSLLSSPRAGWGAMRRVRLVPHVGVGRGTKTEADVTPLGPRGR